MKSQELKNKIIKEILPNLSVDPTGGYVDSKEISKRTYNSLNEYYFRFDPSVNSSWESEPKPIIIDKENILSEQDNLEICRAMIDGIKQSASEWSVEQEGTLTIIKHNSGKKHYEKGFDKEEWVEIENVLNSQQGKNKGDDNVPEDTPSNPSNTEQQAQQEQPPKEIKYMGHIYYRGNKY